MTEVQRTEMEQKVQDMIDKNAVMPRSMVEGLNITIPEGFKFAEDIIDEMSDEERAELEKKAAEERKNRREIEKQFKAFVADLKKKLKNHSKKQLIEVVAKQAWEYNQLQHMARHLYEENTKLKEVQTDETK